MESELEWLGLAAQVLESESVLTGPLLRPDRRLGARRHVQVVPDDLALDSMSEAFQALTTDYRLSCPTWRGWSGSTGDARSTGGQVVHRRRGAADGTPMTAVLELADRVAAGAGAAPAGAGGGARSTRVTGQLSSARVRVGTRGAGAALAADPAPRRPVARTSQGPGPAPAPCCGTPAARRRSDRPAAPTRHGASCRAASWSRCGPSPRWRRPTRTRPARPVPVRSRQAAAAGCCPGPAVRVPVAAPPVIARSASPRGGARCAGRGSRPSTTAAPPSGGRTGTSAASSLLLVDRPGDPAAAGGSTCG